MMSSTIGLPTTRFHHSLCHRSQEGQRCGCIRDRRCRCRQVRYMRARRYMHICRYSCRQVQVPVLLRSPYTRHVTISGLPVQIVRLHRLRRRIQIRCRHIRRCRHHKVKSRHSDLHQDTRRKSSQLVWHPVRCSCSLRSISCCWEASLSRLPQTKNQLNCRTVH